MWRSKGSLDFYVTTYHLKFDDEATTDMHKDFVKQDRALCKLWKNQLPEDHPLRSRFLGMQCKHNMGATPGEVYHIKPNRACAFLRAILLLDKPLKVTLRKELEHDAKGITYRFKRERLSENLPERILADSSQATEAPGTNRPT